jgi:hypothetical protein
MADLFSGRPRVGSSVVVGRKCGLRVGARGQCPKKIQNSPSVGADQSAAPEKAGLVRCLERERERTWRGS